MRFFFVFIEHIFSKHFKLILPIPPIAIPPPYSSTPSFTQPAHISISQATEMPTSQSRFALRWCRIPQVRRISTSWAWPMASRRSLPNGVFFWVGEVYTTPHRYDIASFCVGLVTDGFSKDQISFPPLNCPYFSLICPRRGGRIGVV